MRLGELLLNPRLHCRRRLGLIRHRGARLAPRALALDLVRLDLRAGDLELADEVLRRRRV